MKKCMKTIALIVLCSVCLPVAAANRFIIMYKLSKSQEVFLANKSGADKYNAEEQMRICSLRDSLREKEDSLQLAVSFVDDVSVVSVSVKGDGSGLVLLDADLNEEQTKQFIKKVEQDSKVESIQEDTIMTLSSGINSNYQWDMVNKGEFLKEAGRIGDKFTKAWKLLKDYGHVPGEDVVIAVLDTGYVPHSNYLRNLQPLNGKAGVFGYKFISDCRQSGECPSCTSGADASNDIHSKYEEDGIDQGDFLNIQDIGCLYSNVPTSLRPSPSASSWHGSHVIELIVAGGYSGTNVDHLTGGAYGAKIIPVRVTGKGGGYVSDIIDGMRWAAGLPVINIDGSDVPINQNPVDIINMSIVARSQFGCDPAYQRTIDQLVQNGVLIVVAAGNDQVNITDTNLASCRGVISVAAKRPTNKLAYYSNFGNVTIAASGESLSVDDQLARICSAVWPSDNGFVAQSSGVNVQGTSMATPQVSVAIANLVGILKKQGKSYTSNDIIALLQQNAMKYDNCHDANRCATGYALDMEKAVKSALGIDDTFLVKAWSTTLNVASYVITFIAGGVVVYVYNRLYPTSYLHPHSE